MKEIDFLPAWYKSSRRWQISYRTQYVGLCGIFAVMVVWNFITTHSLTKAQAKLNYAQLQSVSAENMTEEFAKIKDEASRLQEKAKNVEIIDSKINVANILAEISFLVDGKIVLSKVEFIAEKFGNKREEVSNSGSPVIAVAGNFSSKEAVPLGDVRFRILINGVAANASNVAAFVCKLEDSPYFCQVIPLFTRNKDVKAAANTGGEKFQVSEFEISCHLANYRQEEPYSAATNELAEKLQKTETVGL